MKKRHEQNTYNYQGCKGNQEKGVLAGFWLLNKIDDPNSSQDNNNKHNCSYYFNEFEKVNLYVIRN